MTRFVFVTGGVVSSVGKGITVASLGRLLKSRGISVSLQKLDPYLNVDPGTMSPYQHGEVFVTRDGAETDLDLGHYERFIDADLTKESNVTTGQIYRTVIEMERRGDFLGGTIQVVPHVTNAIKQRILDLASLSGAEVLIVEVGGTVGDIEGLPFLEAIRQLRREAGRDNVLYIHVTYVPHLVATDELKTKPTQHSVQELRRIGIQPDMIVCRSDFPLTEEVREKVALHTDVDLQAVVPMPTVDTIYRVPLILEEAGVSDFLIQRLGLTAKDKDLDGWRGMVSRMEATREPLTIALVGKYIELQDAYLSVKEALQHSGLHHGRRIEMRWVQAESLEHEGGEAALSDVQGIVVPGGFGYRGFEGMVRASRYAREHQVPYLGLCFGMQAMVVEYARYVFGSDEANSSEFGLPTRYPVIDFMPDQRNLDEKGGTMRLGAYPCALVPNTKAAAAYGDGVVYERHRHRLEFNNAYRGILGEHGLVISGTSPDDRLVEIVEVPDHPWMVGVQYHPEFRSRPDRPHPLFREFVAVAKETLREGTQRPLPLTPELVAGP